MITTPHPDVVDYPPPTHLKTLKKSDGHSFFHEEELDMWLRNIANNKDDTSEWTTQKIKDFINTFQDQSPKVHHIYLPLTLLILFFVYFYPSTDQ